MAIWRRNRTDRDWQRLGGINPYAAVLGSSEYALQNLDESARQSFFDSGEAHIRSLWEVIERHFVSPFRPERALDFGCGVGRLVIPMAHRSEHVIGVDVSQEMLNYAMTHCTEQSITNIDFVLSDDILSRLIGRYDFLHSYIVFQHIPRRRGEAILERLLQGLEDDGIGALHFVYHRESSFLLNLAFQACQTSSIVRGVANVALLRRRFNHPMMQMNVYKLHKVFLLLQKYNCHDIHVQFSEHTAPYLSQGGLAHWGVLVFFQKQSSRLW